MPSKLRRCLSNALLREVPLTLQLEARRTDQVATALSAQRHERRAPAAALRGSQAKTLDVTALLQDRVDHAPQHTLSLAVHDPQLAQPVRATFIEPCRHEIVNFPRIEGVQVEHAIDRQHRHRGGIEIVVGHSLY